MQLFISLTRVPPQGWQYTQAQTDWQAPAMLDFFTVRDKLIEHRRANPRFNLPTDPETVGLELQLYNAVRINWNPEYCSPMTQDQALELFKALGALKLTVEGIDPKKSLGLPPVKHRAVGLPRKSEGAGVVAVVKKLRAGVGVLLDWLGDGATTVAPELAEKRAQVCAGCPHNQQGGLERWFTVPASERIRKQLEIKQEMALSTTVDDKLEVCDLCLCPMRLKVHVPLDYVRSRLLPEVQSQLPDFCWMKTEV